MSETFLIKKTAFDNSGTILDKEANAFVLGPGEENGPLGLAHNSDLTLYGFGSLKWGEGVDQNLYRILENFACPRKGMTGSPPAYDAVAPMDETDLGVGNGITAPLIGQLWYDITSKIPFVYNGTHWVTVGVEPGIVRIDAKSVLSVNDLECNGQVVSRTRYAALFDVIDITYGIGDGLTTFNVPNIPSIGSPPILKYVIRT